MDERHASLCDDDADIAVRAKLGSTYEVAADALVECDITQWA